jgi:hypothetical protein
LASEYSMTVPLIARAQVRILQEEVVEPTRAPDPLPADLVPSTPFDAESIRAGLPDPGPFGSTDLRGFSRHDGEVGRSELPPGRAGGTVAVPRGGLPRSARVGPGRRPGGRMVG